MDGNIITKMEFFIANLHRQIEQFGVGQLMDENPGVFRVDLTLTTDNGKELQTLTDHIREENFPDCIGWYRLAQMLGNMGQFEKAQQLYERLLEQETVDSAKASVYNELGTMKYQQAEYKEAINFYEKVLPIR